MDKVKIESNKVLYDEISNYIKFNLSNLYHIRPFLTLTCNDIFA